jgi:putative transposase
MHARNDRTALARRDTAAARRFLAKAMAQHGPPDSITIDKSGANHAAIQNDNAEQETAVVIRQNKYLNNLVEQDHCAVKRIIRPMLGFKSFHCARILLAGIEFMHMIRKGQMRSTRSQNPSPAQQFLALAA